VEFVWGGLNKVRLTRRGRYPFWYDHLGPEGGAELRVLTSVVFSSWGVSVASEGGAREKLGMKNPHLAGAKWGWMGWGVGLETCCELVVQGCWFASVAPGFFKPLTHGGVIGVKVFDDGDESGWERRWRENANVAKGSAEYKQELRAGNVPAFLAI